MSFSSDVKKELSKHTGSARHCQIAELAAIIWLCGDVNVSDDMEYEIVVRTENEFVARKCFTLLEKNFYIGVAIDIHQNPHLQKSKVYNLHVSEQEDVIRVLKATNHSSVLQKTCCRRAFLRGSFLAAGSISSPEKSYHMEISCTEQGMAKKIRNLFVGFEIDAKIVIRKKQYVVYIKEGAQIVDALGLMEANVSLMELENIRILKDMRNSVNRKVNCETANLNKTISAAVKQTEDIEYIQRTIGFGSLTPALRQAAEARLNDTEASLIELGKQMNPPVGKSGMNHRLRKLSEIANDLRGNKEESYYD